MEISATQRSLLIADYLLHHRQNGGRVQVLEDLEEQLITEVHEVALRFPVEGFLMLLLPFALFYLRLLLGRDLWQHWLHGHGGQLPPTTFVVREAALRRCKARQAMLQNDFEVGFYLKERVIPKAVIFFTGEIADCQSSSGSETESEDTEDESDAEEEDGVDK